MRSNTFRLSAQNSLKVTELPIDRTKQKQLQNTFKGGNDLRNQLGQNKSRNNQTLLKTGKNMATFQKQSKKSQQQVLEQQIASLDHFKPAVTRDKTKNMIESIKLRRREKHIDTLGRFRQDLEDYKQNLVSIYSSLVNDLEQVMSIKQSHIQQYLVSITDKYLLQREADLINQIQQEVNTYKIEASTKLNDMGIQMQKVKERRGDSVKIFCQNLRGALIQIAFVLQPEARQIQTSERQQIEMMQQKFYTDFRGQYQSIVKKQEQRSQRIQTKSEFVIKKWRQIKQQYEIQQFTKDAESQKYRRPIGLRKLYDRIIQLQQKNHENKMKLVQNLINQDADTISKVNIDRWNQQLKKINQNFDGVFDQLINQLVELRDLQKHNNQQRLGYCKQRLKYIQNHNEQQIQEIIKQKIEPLCSRNINEQEQTIKNITDYVEKHDDRENNVLKSLSQFINKIGGQNDKFIKDFQELNKIYEIEKAKVLDEDEQIVDKLNEQLNIFKQQLKESLHHLKLQQVKDKCFEKVDQLEKAYRNCHQQNKILQKTRKPSIQEFMKKYESKIAELLMLYGPERKAQLEEKNKKDAEEQVARRLEIEEKKKAEEEAKLIEQAKAKGGKPPAPAKKDPKKAAAQLQERRKAILSQIGTKQIQQFKTEGGSLWLVYKNIKQIIQTLYNKKQSNEEKKEGEIKQGDKDKKLDQEKTKAIDAPQDQLKDYQGLPVVSEKSFVRIQELLPYLEALRQKIFDKICEKRDRVYLQAEQADEQMLDESLSGLDNRLKAHYSLKGQIESEIFVKRSGEITGHKKKYEKYARTVQQKMDLQTQNFNFLLQKGLEALKGHNVEQKNMKQHIIKCKNLSQLQGMYSRTRQNYNSFGLTIKEIYNQLDRLSSNEIDVILQKNQDYIKQSRLMQQGGDYSNDQITWYQQMLTQISTQMKDQQIKRKQKFAELKQHSQKKRKQLLDAFQKQYQTTVEELSARDGTGKKYGKPKRIAQEKIRLQMNKCEQAQMLIDKMISELAREYEKNMNNNFTFIDSPPTLEWRKKLMVLTTCIKRYGKHIQAYKPDLKIVEMLRVNYNEDIPECKITPEEQEEDKKRKIQQLQHLGKLNQQKDDRVFMKYIDEIQKIISQQSRTIYVGDKAKFLTGNDKIPDFLRIFITNMKRNAQEFRINSVRQLRQSCNKLTQLSKCISELFFISIEKYYIKGIEENKQKFNIQFHQFIEGHKKLRILHMKDLRPNLVNPKCQDQLKQLDQKQKNRNKQYYENIQKTEKDFKLNLFSKGSNFLNRVLNNYEFLLLYVDSLYLFEDFVNIPGDQISNKAHLDIQKLMVMKQKGIKIDPKSQRNLRRKWQGFDFTIFDVGEHKFSLKKVAEEAPKQKDKKGGKKDSKDPKKQPQQVIESDPNKTKTIETFKTWRQKAVYQYQNQAVNDFKQVYTNIVNLVNTQLKIDTKQNKSHEIKWRQTADSLYL